VLAGLHHPDGGFRRRLNPRPRDPIKCRPKHADL
jgi:hypothetical protein